MEIEFVEFPKIYRVSRPCIITEKIDGTNGQICITEDGEFLVGSRSNWITPQNDNHGFARWAMQNKEELLKLGIGRHYGEWWGEGIQRSYGLKEKRFSLFNTSRWSDASVRPACCHIVPVLYEGIFDTARVEECIARLRTEGSIASPGFKRPEGIVCYHIPGNFGLKKTLEKDEEPKGIKREKTVAPPKKKTVCPFRIVERYADNGALSHYDLINSSTGTVVWSQQPIRDEI